MSSGVSKSWFCVFNNPSEHGYIGTPVEIADKVLEEWIEGNPTRTGAVAYCVSADGLQHLHLVLEDTKAMRFSVVKKAFPSMHIEPTKGNKEQAEDYIHKRGKFEEKGEEVVYIAQHGQIKGAQGARRDLSIIDDLLEQGKTPNEIMAMNIMFRKYEKMIKDAYFDKRVKETPFLRDVNVVWHVGESGSGKTYSVMKLIEDKGEENVYFISDYEGGGLDKYAGESILFLDEFRGQIRYSTLLGMLQGYKQQFHARYTNVIGLWNEVHISTVLPPEDVYKNMVSDNRNVDTIKQLMRRIRTIVYHWKDSDIYNSFELSMNDYKNYEGLKSRAISSYKGISEEEYKYGWMDFEPYQEELPFD